MLVTAGFAATVYYLLHVPRLSLPAGITQRTERLTLTGKPVKVDFYVPSASDPAGVVIIAHGFTRNRKTMAGWGSMLAREGFLAVVPNLPSWADHARNGRALAELLAEVRTGKLIPQPQPSGGVALVGFSAGGLSTLLAAAGNTNVSCWIGLDPVAMGPWATRAAESLHIPCFVLRAEPAPWNANGSARRIFAALPGPAFSLAVKNATHVDAENPTSRAAEWACGRSDPARRDAFGRYLLASLRASLLRDQTALRLLTAATNDTAVREVLFRKSEELRFDH
ncbi:MAG: alpha/beta fold hydrolase [Verrucomicrobia bacterium]|nr:alpha/beta fold hydrolase [Verrucomicrobiota bacterium]